MNKFREILYCLVLGILFSAIAMVCVIGILMFFKPEENVPEPLEINTLQNPNKGVITVYKKEEQEVFQYEGEISYHYCEYDGKLYINVQLPDTGWTN